MYDLEYYGKYAQFYVEGRMDDAERYRFIRRVLAARARDGHRGGHILNRLGATLISWGSRLQGRYGPRESLPSQAGCQVSR